MGCYYPPPPWPWHMAHWPPPYPVPTLPGQQPQPKTNGKAPVEAVPHVVFFAPGDAPDSYRPGRFVLVYMHEDAYRLFTKAHPAHVFTPSTPPPIPPTPVAPIPLPPPPPQPTMVKPTAPLAQQHPEQEQDAKKYSNASTILIMKASYKLDTVELIPGVDDRRPEVWRAAMEKYWKPILQGLQNDSSSNIEFLKMSPPRIVQAYSKNGDTVAVKMKDHAAALMVWSKAVSISNKDKKPPRVRWYNPQTGRGQQ